MSRLGDRLRLTVWSWRFRRFWKRETRRRLRETKRRLRETKRRLDAASKTAAATQRDADTFFTAVATLEELARREKHDG